MFFFQLLSRMFLFRKCENVFMCNILEPQALTLYFKVVRNEIDVSHNCKMPKISRTGMN